MRRRLAVQHARDKGFSERHACTLVGQWRTSQRYQPTQSNDEDRLTQSILAFASQYGRFGYRRITALLRQAGWKVGKDRVQRIWRREGLKVPAKHKPRGRLWLNDGSCIRQRPEHRNHVWSYDFVEARTHDGRSLRLLVMIDEFTRECLAIRVEQRPCDRTAGRLHASIRRAGACEVGQRRGDDGAAREAVAGIGGNKAVIHRAGESMGERIL